MQHLSDPMETLASIRREFGEHGGVNMSVEASSTFTVLNPLTMPELFEGDKTPRDGCYLYGRSFNPTVYHLSRQIAALEGADAAYCTASGMAAISGAILGVCDSGSHIVSANTVYGGTYALLHDFLPVKANIQTSFVDVSDHQAIEAAITPETKVLYAESISNPTLRITDIEALAEIAKSHGLKLIIDNTFSPLAINPVALGADVVVYSLTKYMNGASDIVGGAICSTGEYITDLMDLHFGPLMVLGPTMDPSIASQISLRLPHLGLRIKAHAERAMAISQRLDDLGLAVTYPGLSSHPDRDLMRRQGHPDYGCGGLLTLDLQNQEAAEHLMETLQNDHGFGYIAVSLGYFDTLMSAPRISTSSEMTDEDLESAGISGGLLRISLGYTGSLEQRWAQLKQGLKTVGVI